MADTIAAVATGWNISAIGIIRMSGEDAISIASRVFRSVSGKKLSDAENRKLYYGYLLDDMGRDIDMCLCTISRAPHSYTGENTVEFQCHGSPTVLREGLHALFKAGARQATAGEFTKRAFLNGCMDLTQAEAVIDLIDSETSAAARNAVGHLGKTISNKTDGIYRELMDISAHFHAVLDYPDEDIEDFTLEAYADTMKNGRRVLKNLLDTYERGIILRDGVTCAVIGKPNVGKSSILNALLGYDRAIVTDIAGTTRDTIEERLKIGDVVLRIADTAGIRDTEDTVEKIGVERAREAATEAQLVIAVLDASRKIDDDDMEILNIAKSAEKAIIAVNKTDIRSGDFSATDFSAEKLFMLSAKTGDGINELCKEIENEFSGTAGSEIGYMITNARQAEAIEAALSSLDEAINAMETGLTPDLVLTMTEQAMENLGLLSGKTVREDITARIFERFCVGK